MQVGLPRTRVINSVAPYNQCNSKLSVQGDKSKKRKRAGKRQKPIGNNLLAEPLYAIKRKCAEGGL